MTGSNNEKVVVRMLADGELHVLDRVAPDVFDDAVDPALAGEFLADPRHHLAVALDADTVVGMASALHYVHPDKPPELWVNEVGVSPAHRGQRIATRLIETLFEHARTLGCRQAWVLTEHDNAAAQRLYAGVGGQGASVVMYSFQLGEDP